MSDDHDFIQDKRVAEHIQEQSKKVKALSMGSDLPPNEFSQLLNFSKRLKQSEENKNKIDRDNNLSQLYPHLEMIDVANKNLQEASQHHSQAVNHAVSCAKKLDQTYTEYSQELVKASQSSFHEQPFIVRHPAFNMDAVVPNVVAHHQTLLDQQSELDQNFSSKKGALINILLRESKDTPVNPSLSNHQKGEVNSLRAKLREARKNYDAALEKLNNASAEDKATYENIVKGHQESYQQTANKLIDIVTYTVIQPDSHRKNDRIELEGLLAKAHTAANDEEKARLIEQIKVRQTEYKEKYGQSAFLDDSILRYKQAEQDCDLGKKAIAVCQAKIDLDNAHQSQMTSSQIKTKTANELTQTKEKAKPFFKKCVEALQKLVNIQLFKAKFHEEQWTKKMEGHMNAMDAAPNKHTKKP